MKVKSLHLQNYGRFEDLKIDFAPTADKTSNVTVIVGNNGAGKSQILQALATGLSWFVSELTNNSKLSISIENKVVTNGVSIEKCSVSLQLQKHSKISKISVGSGQGVGYFGFNRNFEEDFVEPYRRGMQQNFDNSLPIVALYPVERTITGEFVANFSDIDGSQLFAYNSALNGSKIDFQEFFQWFRSKEDVENEMKSHQMDSIKDSQRLQELRASLDKLQDEKRNLEDEIDNNSQSENKDFYTELGKIQEQTIMREAECIKLFTKINLSKVNDYKRHNSLSAVRYAIEYFTDFKNPRIRRQGTPTMIVEKDGEELDVNQLSQGEKSLLALVGDIARRLALLNPSLDNPLEGEGVVMIDEVDLHLHPKWQHDLIDKLVKTFPNVQFILTTHSPHVISDRNDILLYSLDDGELTEMPNVYGEDANTVLTKIFDVDIRDSKVEEQFNIIRRAISSHDYLTAESKIAELAEELPSDHLELLKCRLLLAHSKIENDKKSYAED